MHRIVSAFGVLEYFKKYAPEHPAGPIYPPGHDASRDQGVDSNVYEVKWQQRDDCIVALNACFSLHSYTPI